MTGGLAGLAGTGGLYAFLYWLIFGLCKMVYGTIPALYDAFIFFAKYQFFDLDTDIKQIWGNLYVLLSVLVLFAIAIKLINAIVNPDVLTDNKKGVKKAYFSAIVAVFLTVLTPYAFTLLVHVQDNIIDNKTIEKLFFNSTSAEQNGGKIIAWTAITSFINLNELADATAGTSHQYNLDTTAVNYQDTRIYVLSEEVDTGLDSIFKSQPWQHTDTVHQNPILMLLAGCLIAYEFILLVLDTALRSIKLGLLQMMTPIILGAYIFKEDILKKWALEYIKTFIQIFLLFISISLLTKVLALLPNILVGAEFTGSSNSWLLAGIINVLAIMAALRLVKQVIPIINKIFGTNIQGKGGIKGRLGEMAMVGGLAQKAWSALGTGAKNAAGFMAKAPFALAGAGLGAGANALSNRFFGKKFTDTKPVRGIRAAGKGIGTALKTGSVSKTYQSAIEGYKAPGYTTNELSRISSNALKAREAGGVNEHGVYNNLDANGEFKTNTKHDQDAAAILDGASKTFRGQNGQKLVTSMTNRYNADKKANLLNGIKSSRDKVSTQLSSLHSSMASSGLYDAETLSKIDKIAKEFDAKGRISTKDANYLNQYLSEGASELLSSTYGKMQRGISDAKSTFADLSGADLNGAVALGNTIAAATKDAAGYKADEESMIANMSEGQKAQYKIFSEGLTEISSTTAGASQNDKNIHLTGDDDWAEKPDDFKKAAQGGVLSGQQTSTTSTTSSSTTSSTSSSSSSTSSSETVSQPETLNTGASSDRSYFDAQIDARMDYLEGKDTLTAAEEAELRSLQQTERAAQREYEQTQEYRDQQAQEQHDREVQERNAEIEELNRRANNRPLTRAEQMRREQLNSAKEYDENGGSIDE